MTPLQRSKCMSKIRSSNTKPERMLRKELWARGVRYRLGYHLPGKPDLVFVGSRLAVFIDGCFWHKCPVHYTIPKSNRDFWVEKLQRNQERDHRVNCDLAKLGWTVERFWEHEIVEKLPQVAECIEKIVRTSKCS